MNPAPQRSAGQIVRNLAIGIRVGTLIGVAWMAYGVSLLAPAPRMLAGVIGIVIALVLSSRSRRLADVGARMPPPSSEQRAAGRRVWILFWINFALELVLLNIAIRVLGAPQFHLYWIPAISLIVGLHFLPMASFMKVPSYWFCGGAMMIASVVFAVLLHLGIATPTLLLAIEALVNAALLWIVAAWGLRNAAALARQVGGATR
ncbi:hypothetical protein [Solimonas marina]|uniref:Uncharacterized protein n=1 Tax=Solimonas marina TaxID=2714601 RepID=A0A970B7W4_9GAMM|nr:hypothetical protein [Solimonas marina]NKF20826.1 hypothetical protein [Solimonas marina]